MHWSSPRRGARPEKYKEMRWCLTDRTSSLGKSPRRSPALVRVHAPAREVGAVLPYRAVAGDDEGDVGLIVQLLHRGRLPSRRAMIATFTKR